jgi:CheY-like chemotaxis protein
MPSSEPVAGVVLCDDLMWVSRLTGIASDLGYRLLPVATTDRLERVVIDRSPRLLILDLASLRTDVAEFVVRLRSLQPSVERVVAFGSHVDVAGLRAAREAGCDPVLPRSRMAEDFVRLLPDWLGVTGSGDASP